MLDSVDSLTRRLAQSPLVNECEMQGCSHQELEQLEKSLHKSLPNAYKEFLIACGNGAGMFLVGTDWTYPKLIALQTEARQLLASQDVGSLPQSSFVFTMHQGYSFLYFSCAAGDDPPVFVFVDGETSPREVFARFSQWLRQCIEDEIKAYIESDRE